MSKFKTVTDEIKDFTDVYTDQQLVSKSCVASALNSRDPKSRWSASTVGNYRSWLNQKLYNAGWNNKIRVRLEWKPDKKPSDVEDWDAIAKHIAQKKQIDLETR